MESTTSAATTVTAATLAAFSDAWNEHNIDAIMSFMSDDCVFKAAAGPDASGTVYTGAAAVREAFIDVWRAIPDAHWSHGRYLVQGTIGLSQWTFTGTAADGSRIETDGIDQFEFDHGKIRVKNAFRKMRPNLPALK